MESACLENSTRLKESSVTIFAASSPTEALLSSPVRIASPLLNRALSMTVRGLPEASSISTLPSW